MSLNPEVADLVKSLALNIDSVKGPTNSQLTLTTPPTSMNPDSSISPPVHFNPTPIGPTPSDINTSPNNHHPQLQDNMEHSECMPHPMDMGPPPRMPCPPYMPGECGPPPPGPGNGMRPLRGGGPPRPRIGDPYHHPRFPQSDMAPLPPPHFARFPMSHQPFRSPPPSMYAPGRPPMNAPPRGIISRRGGRPEPICKFFQQGNCRNGNNCHFFHPGYPQPNWWHLPSQNTTTVMYISAWFLRVHNLYIDFVFLLLTSPNFCTTHMCLYSCHHVLLDPSFDVSIGVDVVEFMTWEKKINYNHILFWLFLCGFFIRLQRL